MKPRVVSRGQLSANGVSGHSLGSRLHGGGSMLAEQLELRLRLKRAYEWGRLRHALRWSVPTLLLAALVALLVRQVSWPLPVGLLLYLASVVMLWVGRSPGRSVLPRVVYGLL